MDISYFLFFVVLAMLLFMYVYAKYSQFDSDIKRRKAELEEKREKTAKRIETIDYDMSQRKIEMAVITEKINALKEEIGL